MDLMPAQTDTEVAIEYLFRMSGGVRWSAWVSLQGAFREIWSSTSCVRTLGLCYGIKGMQSYLIKYQVPDQAARPPWRLRSWLLDWSDRGKCLSFDGINYTFDCAGGTIRRADLPCYGQTTLVVLTPGPPDGGGYADALVDRLGTLTRQIVVTSATD